MKIGILTFNNTLNYGAVLQMYALCKKINLMGYNCEVINYECKAVEIDEIGFSLPIKKNMKQKIKNLLMYNIQNSNLLKFKNFTKDYIKCSAQRYTRDNIFELEKNYDSFIVGSDQIWNLELTKGDTTYFLDFIHDNKRKRSYAASFGYSTIPEKYVDLNRNLLKNFECLNVREISGKNLINKLLPEKSVNVTIDPTLLLDCSEWNQLITNKRKKEKKYILVYLPSKDKNTMNMIKMFAKKNDCSVKYIHRSFLSKKNMKNIKDASPIEFLELIKNSEYVITGSFHAMCFSIIFNKQFYYTIPPITNRGSRLIDLANLLNIKDREFKLKNINDNNFIDYTTVNEVLKSEREKSIKILYDTLKK